MKMRNLLAVIIFMAAIGSAIASEYLMVAASYTSKFDVPAQAGDCQLRGQCVGSTTACTITLDHDGNAATPQVTVPLRDGVTQQGSQCGIQLMRN